VVFGAERWDRLAFYNHAHSYSYANDFNMPRWPASEMLKTADYDCGQCSYKRYLNNYEMTIYIREENFSNIRFIATGLPIRIK